MKQLEFAIPLSKAVVLADLKRRCDRWGLPAFAYALLERWYELGWDDGIVAFDRYTLAEELNITAGTLDEGIELLEDLHLVTVRRGLSHEVAELLALSNAHPSNGPYLGWWQLYLLEIDGWDD